MYRRLGVLKAKLVSKQSHLCGNVAALSFSKAKHYRTLRLLVWSPCDAADALSK